MNLFGMPEAPHDLYVSIANFMIPYRWEVLPFDLCLYIRSESKANMWDPLFIVAHVDNLGLAVPDKWGDQFVQAFRAVFDTEDMGPMQ